MFKIGQQVRFVGRPQELGKYHPDYAQLLGQVGTVVEADCGGYEVMFEGFEWSGKTPEDMDKVPRNWFTCWRSELEAA